MRLSTGGDPELWQMRQILQGLEADAQPGQRWETAGLTERKANSSEMLKGGAYRGQAPPPPTPHHRSAKEPDSGGNAPEMSLFQSPKPVTVSPDLAEGDLADVIELRISRQRVF